MKWQLSASVVVLALAAAGCSEAPTSPAPRAAVPAASLQSTPKGTGLVLNSLTGVALPVIGSLGDITIDQAEVTNFALVENTVGAIVGLQADGVLQLTGGVLGTDVLTENFTTTASVTSSGPGQCTIIGLDLGSISVDALGIANVDIPAASLTGKGSGAVGSLLCTLGNLLSGLTSGGVGLPGAQGVVTALNNQIG
ncbi:MAG TPA: hypothetical protein VJU87_10515 [Gemmatimonadaceae bacterium]|nr:hypothetical protein [Gemmatimonadaceae bacterium]